MLQQLPGPRCCEAKQGKEKAGINSRTRCEAGDIKREEGKWEEAGRGEKQCNSDMGELNLRGIWYDNQNDFIKKQ